jgi:HSP20 family molecular chaperone IbpA
MNELSERANGERVWTPTIETVWPFDRWLNGLWNESFVSITPGTFFLESEPTSASWRSEIVDRGDAFEVVVVLPGIPKEQIGVTVQGTRLKIHAELSAPRDEPTPQGVHPGSGRRSFERTFELPEPTPASSIQARAENGVLTVRIAKPKPLPEERVPLA